MVNTAATKHATDIAHQMTHSPTPTCSRGEAKDAAWLLRHLDEHRYDMRLTYTGDTTGELHVALATDATSADVLRAYLHSLLIEMVRVFPFRLSFLA